MRYDYSSIPVDLRQYKQWVLWKRDARDNGKVEKIPYQITGQPAKTGDPSTWTSFEAARSAYQQSNGNFAGIGFVFSQVDPFVDIDYDGALPVSGNLTKLLHYFNSFTEFSQSEKGLHTFIQGKKHHSRCKFDAKNYDLVKSLECKELEIYEKGRFFAMTGKVFENYTTLQYGQKQLNAFFRRLGYVGTVTDQYAPVIHADECLKQAVLETLQTKGQGLFDNYEDFLRLGYALKSEEIPFSAFDAIVRQSANYDQEQNRKLYEGLKPGKITFGTAYHYAEQADPEYLKTLCREYGNQQRHSNNGNGTRPDTIKDIDFSKHETDLGNARRLVNRFGRIVKFCAETNTWYVWTGKYWKADTVNNAGMMKFAKETVKGIYAECESIEGEDSRKNRAKWARASEAKKRMVDMIFLAQTEREVEVSLDDLDHHPYLLNCQNGIIDLTTGNLQSHAPENLLTTYVDIPYDPKANCPTWELAIMKYMGYTDNGGDTDNRALGLYEFLQRAVGYTLTGDISEQCFFFLYGDGRNGKSTFINILSSLLADYSKHIRIQSLLTKKYEGVPNDLAQLPGARLVISSEIPGGKRLDESLVKDLTGGDAITARFMRNEFFTFHPIFKLWIFGNDKPRVSPSEALFRRIHLIPFNVQIPLNEVTPHFENELKKELPGILRWAVDGCLDWQRNRLHPPQPVIDATQAYRDEMDILSDFVEERCFVNEGSRSVQVKVKDLYENFVTWCDSERREAIRKKDFNKRLQKKFPCLKRERGDHNALTWYGIGLYAENTGEK